MDRAYFDRLVSRDVVGNLKRIYTPERVTAAGCITYWGAEFDFPSCPAFAEGVRKCADNGLFGFNLQDERYDRAVSGWLQRMRGMQVPHEWIVPTHGTIFALSEAIRLFLGEDERMLVLLPGYDRYAQAARRNGVETQGVYLIAEMEKRRYRIDWDALRRAMRDPKNRLLVLTQPNNPTGTAYSPQELAMIRDLAGETHTAVFSDEIFAECVRDNQFRVPSYLDAVNEEDEAIVCTGLGKCMSLTGVNHANVLIRNPELRKRFVSQKYRDHYGSIDPMLYWGLVNACGEDGADYVRTMNEVTRENGEYMARCLKQAFPEACVYQADAGFVLWADFTPCGLTDEALNERLETDALLYGSHGDEYGVSNQYRRFNLAVPPPVLRRSMQLLAQASETWQGGECK